MKRILIASLVSALSVGPIAYADDAHHPDKDTSAAGSSAQPPVDQTAQRMQENVKRMQSQVDRVRKAKDAGERDRLLADHMQTMRENMALGQSMMQGGAMGMMGGRGMGMMGGRGGMGMMDPAMMDQCMKMMGGASGTTSADISARMAQMEKRMDMMQMMMQRMAGAEAPAAAKTQ